MWNFAFFARSQITDVRLFVCLFVCFLFFFPRGNRISDQKNGWAPRPPPTLIFSPKSPDQNSEIAILFTIVEKPNIYVFRDVLLPRSPRGRGCRLGHEKLQNFDLCLHIVMVTGKCTDLFRGIFGLVERVGGGGGFRGYFHGDTPHGGREFQ